MRAHALNIMHAILDDVHAYGKLCSNGVNHVSVSTLLMLHLICHNNG
jgi:hypothetical protein